MTSEYFTYGVSFAELMETRRIAEPELAARAAVRKTEANLNRLESAVHALHAGQAAGCLNAAVDSETRFHKALWDAAGDRVICRMLAPVHLAMGGLVHKLWLLDDYRVAVGQYGNILVAVRSGNPAAASRAMTVHLETTAAILSRVLPCDPSVANYGGGSYSIVATMLGPSRGRSELTSTGVSELSSALACSRANFDSIGESRDEGCARRSSGTRSRQMPLESSGQG